MPKTESPNALAQRIMVVGAQIWLRHYFEFWPYKPEKKKSTKQDMGCVLKLETEVKRVFEYNLVFVHFSYFKV